MRISTLATQISPKSCWFKTLRGFGWISRWHFTISWRQAAHRPVACPGPQRETPPPSRRQSGSGPPNPAAYCATSARSGLAVLHQSAANSGNWFDSTRGEQAELRYGWMEPCVVQFSLSIPCAMGPNRGIYKRIAGAHTARDAGLMQDRENGESGFRRRCFRSDTVLAVGQCHTGVGVLIRIWQRTSRSTRQAAATLGARQVCACAGATSGEGERPVGQTHGRLGSRNSPTM